MKNNILGLILIIFGALITFVGLGDLILRLAIAALGLYLVYHGLVMRNPHHQYLFYFHNFKDRFGRF